MKKHYTLLLLLSLNISFSQTITGNYILQLFKGVGGDEEITNKAKEIKMYKYTFSDYKSEIELINPTGTQIDTLKKYNPEYNFYYETVENTISFSKSKYVKDLKNGFYEKIWVIDGKETYEKKELPKIDWQITNETKNIDGFICKKATAKHTTAGYTLQYSAWYCENIPINDGPFEYVGLPGFIFELGVENLFICKFINFKYDENLKIKIDNINHSN